MHLDESILPDIIDGKVSRFLYFKSILFGCNTTVREFTQDLGSQDSIIEGDFIVTLSKKALIITKNHKPFIVKSWKSIDFDSYYDEKKVMPYMISGVNPRAVFQDFHSDYWELVEDDEGLHLILKHKNKTALTLTLA